VDMSAYLDLGVRQSSSPEACELRLILATSQDQRSSHQHRPISIHRKSRSALLDDDHIEYKDATERI